MQKWETRILRIGWILLFVNGIAILGFGIAIAMFPRIAAGVPAEEGLARAIGVATTGMGIFGVMITLGPYRRKRERWAWFTLWYYPLFWAVHLVAGLPPGSEHIHQIVFIILSLLGLLLPAGQFFQARSISNRS